MITHVPPWTSPQVQANEAADAFHGVVELATAGAEIWV
jgi:hypothetical protein